MVAMAFSSWSSKALFSVLLLTTVLCYNAYGYEFQVGGTARWRVPPANETDIYLQWASHNRFLVGDSIRFKYKKDSVMEVDEEGYKNCNSSHPNMFSNNGNTVFKFPHAGSFYFISGASGHCLKGQKMIVRVLPLDHDDSLGHHNSSSAFHHHVSPFLPNIFFFVFAFVASYVI